MEILLATLNSKYIHSNLAIRYLKEITKDIKEIDTLEFTINQSIDFIVSEIYKLKKDMICFSVYIWNIEETLEVCKILQIINPDIKILLGGPEVSYDVKSVMEKYDYIDFIIYGEGEETFREFIIENKKDIKDYKGIRGLSYKEDGEIIINPERHLMKDLNIIPTPYSEITNEFKNKIVYYESSRGCPFGCKFCLSSTINGVRYFDIERVKKDLKNLIAMGVKQIKFVDRTFNANKRYSREIMEFIIKEDPKNINFHFEVTAHLIDEETLNFLGTVKEGLFQFEIGVQSTNEKTIEAIGRTTDFKVLSSVTKKIQSFKNIHQHLDLIGGLPYEDYNSFKRSFDDVYNLKPEKIQLGFLKLLKGSELRLKEKEYGYKYLNKPPYEVLENKFISYGDILKLKDVEDLVEKYYNEGYFKHTIEFLMKNYFNSSFEFYEEFAIFWNKNGYHKISHSRNKLYKILFNFIEEKEFKDKVTICNLLKYDYIFNNKKTRLPFKFEEKENGLNFNIHHVLKDERILNNSLQRYKDIPTKKIINKVNVVRFSIDILDIILNDYIPSSNSKEIYLLFDYLDGNITKCKSYDITNIVRSV